MQVLRIQDLPADEVIDIGVFEGTPWLYTAFPKADFLLVDPQRNCEAMLIDRPKKPYRFLPVGVGAEPGEMALLAQGRGGGSGFLPRTALTAREEVEDSYRVPVETLDRIIAQNCTSGTIGVKIDTEGFEMEVIKGLRDQIHRVSFIIAEVSVRRRFKDGYNFSQLIAALLEKDFVFLNILNRSVPKPLFYDCLFVRSDDNRLG